MPKMNLTDAFVFGVSVDSRTEFWDTAKHSSVVLRVSPGSNGAKSWSVVYRRPRDGRKARVTLGSYPGMSLSRARERSREVLAALPEGADPTQEKLEARRAITVAELVPDFIAKYAKIEKKSWREDERLLRGEVIPAIGSLRVSGLTHRDVLDMIQAKAAGGAPVAADRLLAVTRKMLGWAMDELELTKPTRQWASAPGQACDRATESCRRTKSKQRG